MIGGGNKLSNKIIVIFSGYNQRAIIAFARTLDKNSIPFAIIAAGADDTIFLSDYASNVIYTRKIVTLDIVEIQHALSLIKTRTSYDELIIAPSTEALNRFLLENEMQFINYNIPLVNLNLYQKISDKEKFTQLCDDNNITTPSAYNSLNSNHLPIVAKPKKYQNTLGKALKPILIFDKKSLTDFKKSENQNDYFYQDFIEGESLYFLYFFSTNGEYFSLVQKNLMQQEEGGSMLAAVCSDSQPHQTEIKKYANLFIKLGFNGLVMIEVKRSNQAYFMIEANPRFWGPSQLFVDSEYNLFDAFLADLGLSNFNQDKQPKIGTHYFWSNGINKTELISYHDYSYAHFLNHKEQWLNADIYNRTDTQKIHLKESTYEQ